MRTAKLKNNYDIEVCRCKGNTPRFQPEPDWHGVRCGGIHDVKTLVNDNLQKQRLATFKYL